MDTYRTNFYQLAVFAEAIERGSLTRAAEIFQVTQPVVSRIVKGLENEYGAPLIRRNRQSIVPTPAGEIVYALARDTLAAHHHARAAMHELEAATHDSLSIGVASSAYERAAPLVAQLLSVHPRADIRVKIDSSEVVADEVRNRELDAGIIIGYAVNRHGVASTRVWKEQLIAVVSPEHSAASPGSGKDIWANVAIITTESDAHLAMLRHHLLPMLPQGNEFAVIRCGSPQFVRKLVSEGVGITALPLAAVEQDLATGQLVRVPGVDLEPVDMRLIENPRAEASTLVRELRELIGAAEIVASV